MALRTRNAVLLAKIEPTEGQDAAPSASTDAVLVENPQINFNPNLIETDEVTGSLDGAGPIVGGMTAEVTFDVLLKGSGSAGSVPEYGDLLKACGWAETITAAAIPAAPEACAAGGSTTTAVLGTSASSTNQIYRGMPIDFTGTPAGSAFVSDYSGGSKTATLTDTLSGSIGVSTNYQIPANVLYAPASVSISALTIYLYLDGLLYKLVGCRGSFNLTLTSGGVGRLSFTFQGLYLSKADAAVPAATYDATRPAPFKNGTMLVNRLAAALESLTVDLGNEQSFPDNPNALELRFHPSYPGAGVFRISQHHILTKQNFSRSRWNLDPALFGHAKISYHSETSWRDGYFQSYPRAQEYVIHADDAIVSWASQLIQSSTLWDLD